MRYLSFILAVCVLAAVVGCDNGGIAPSKRLDVETWRCVHEADIAIAVIVRSEGRVYVEVRADTVAGAVSFLNDDLSAMLKDGHWQQIEDTKPLLGPPPPGWNNMAVADKLPWGGVRINGSEQMPGLVYEALPVHDEIEAVDLFPVK